MSAWGLVDDRAGHSGQVLGVLMRLGIPYSLKRLEYNAFSALPSSLIGASLLAVDRSVHPSLASPYPKLVVAAGRRTLPVLRYIKRKSPSTATIYLMHPESMQGVDLAVVPEHDGVKPSHSIITTLAPLHAVTPTTLIAARQQWAPQFADMPRPFIMLCLGGSTKQGDYTPGQWREIIQRSAALAGQGSLLITTSRRTPKEALDLCEPLLQLPHVLHRWDRDKDNPYLGMLACADGIVVTGDSLSMCAEACVSGAPVFIYASENVAPHKHQQLHQALYDRGLAQRLTPHAQLDWKPAMPLDDVGRVADEIKQRFRKAFVPSATV